VLLSRIFGLLRDVAVAAFYGASGLTDAFFVAFAIPNLFRALFAEGALSSAFVPFLSDNMKKGGEREASAYLSNLVMVLTIIILILTLIMIIFPKPIIYAFMPGYKNSPEILAAATVMLRILMPYLLFVSICGLYSGYLNLKGNYFVPYSSTAVLNIFMIAGAYLGFMNDGNIFYLCYSVFLGGLAQLLYIYVFAVKNNYRPAFKTKVRKDVKSTFALLGPSLIGVGINQLNFTLGRIVASFLAMGSISYLYYANRLFQFPLGLFAVVIGTVSLTEISKANSDGDKQRRIDIIDKAFLSVFMVILPATAGLIILSVDITQLVYQRSEFELKDVTATAAALRMYSAGLIFYSFISVLSRVFHSSKDTKTPVKAAGVSLIVYAASIAVLTKPMGHEGIALASSIAAGVNALLLYFWVKDYSLDLSRHLKPFLSIVASTTAMGLAAYFIDIYGINVIINIVICIVLYFLALRITGIKIKEMLR